MPIKPLKIGVTGGIGSGKTLVCNVFSTLGIPVYNADLKAKDLMVKDQNVVEAIKNDFGKEAYLDDNKLDRNYLSALIFSDKKKLKLLNGIVHPAVAADFDNWSQNQVGKLYVIKEAALLIESGSYKLLDYIITVTAPVQNRVERVLSRDTHRSKQDVLDIISNQLSDDEKADKSNFVIDNSGLKLLIPQVLKIHEFLISLKLAG